MNYYIADLHLGHANIIRLSSRPYKDVDEMDNDLINRWNSVITDTDDIYIIGDLIFKTSKGYDYYLKQLNGKKHLIVGNHDHRMLKQKGISKYFESINDLLTITDNGKSIVLCHYPLAEWPGFYRGACHFFGHIHNNENDACKVMRKVKNSYNVGADIIGFTPRTANQIFLGLFHD